MCPPHVSMYSFPFVSPCPSPRHKYVLPKWHQLPHRHLPPVLPLEGHFLSNSWRSGHRLLQLLVRSVLAGQTLPRDPEVTWTLASSSLFSPRRTPDRCNSLILEIVVLTGLRASRYPYRLSPPPPSCGSCFRFSVSPALPRPPSDWVIRPRSAFPERLPS